MDDLRKRVVERNKNEPEFLQAFDEVCESLKPLLDQEPRYLTVLEAMAEPERVISFRVSWVDDKGLLRTNRGYRVQYNSAIGPYKGGLRLHPSVTLSVLKFLGFEQTFKNALTGLSMGGGKGGSDFDPKGKSDKEVRSFCQAFMTELSRYIGPDVDVPAGDIGVGGREIGYLFGQYKTIRNEFAAGVLTGKGLAYGGSKLRPEATGYGAVYFADLLLENGVKGKRCAVSGSGNAAQYTVEKLLALGATVVSVSDSLGTLEFSNGATTEDLEEIKTIKQGHQGPLANSARFKDSNTYKYTAAAKPWKTVTGSVDIAFPSATQNEIDEEDAKALAQRGCKAVIEVANMPSTPKAIKIYRSNNMLYGPGKATNAGGVAVSGMEMAQNSSRDSWTAEEVDNRLKAVMAHILSECQHYAKKYCNDVNNIEAGANIAGFLKVADAMIQQGIF